ncbi:related to acetyl-hydrolase [Rhynchosporium agropyri]|uniref:Related to acetyl-hydrolase n=1 Tax=Rhynchosporium agropyri TaxID=914238 RepID=A0A1E1L331_9HELO|nr:related to acetyl-hydrolase [Rhynchosporium agropyri]
MDTSPIPMLKAFLPKVPLMGKTAVFHALGFSQHSKYWDLRTELTINVLRSFITDSPPRPLFQLQRMSIKGPEIKGRIWISKVTMPKPKEDDVRTKLFKAIEGLREDGSGMRGFKEPDLMSVEAEWTGYRAGATKDSNELKISEEEKYREIMKEVESPTTVLYFHGGAYYLMDPATHRPTTKKLAKITKGRCLSIRYRLAPQHPFPTALLDALVSYLTLLYPPPSSFHTPVLPQHIVFAGDSAGGNLSLALLQTILELNRQNLKITWNGSEREIPVPAGVATCSPWADITHSSPSCETNQKFDYLPSLAEANNSSRYPPDNIWPASPPRKNLYAEDSVLTHPLVSPLSAKSWKGSCPLYIETGQELLTDEARQVACKAAKQGVKVVYEEYETMPHCFAMVLETLPASRMFFESWATFIKMAVERQSEIVTKGRTVKPKSLETRNVDVEKLSGRSDEEVLRCMRERVRVMSGEVPDPIAKL